MQRRFLAAAILFSASMTATASPTDVAQPVHPPTSSSVFSTQSFDDALAASRQQGRTLIVMFSAHWCGPCKAMENSTWRDPGVAAWVRDHGVALHVDIDQQRSLADRFNARSLPLLIAFRNGEVVDRSLGFKDASQMQTWLTRVGTPLPSSTSPTTSVVAAPPPDAAPATPITPNSAPPNSTPPAGNPGQVQIPTQIAMPTTTRVVAPATRPRAKPDQDPQVRRVGELHQQTQQQISTSAGNVAKQNAARKSFRERVAEIYASSINGPSERLVLEEALRVDNTAWMRIALVQAALDARLKRPEHAKLLDEAKARGADISKTKSRLNAMK